MTKALTWERNKKYYVSSTCGRYKVSKANVGDEVKYTAWRIKQDKREVLLDICDTPDEAKAKCQQHADSPF